MNVTGGRAEVRERREIFVISCTEGSPGKAEKSRRIGWGAELILESDLPKRPKISPPVCPCLQLILL